jgi:hypothetical protein
VTAFPLQTPAWQLSPWVQALLSSQAPLFFGGFEHIPVVRSHVPAVWHWSGVGHVTTAPPHLPSVHTSPSVQALPSLQVVPVVLLVWGEHRPVAGTHAPGLWH